jgi:hypothetical protein
MANKSMKKCSTSMAIKEMQIKSTLRFHFTLVRMTIINITNNSKCWGGCGGKGTLLHYWWECKLVQYGGPSKKLKVKLLYDPVIPLLGIYLKECAPGYNRATCTSMFNAAQ